MLICVLSSSVTGRVKMSLSILLLILTFVIALLGLIAQRYYKDRIPKWLFIALVSLLLISFLANVHQTQQDELKAEYLKNSGTLSGKLENQSIIYPSISLGSAEFVWQGEQGEPIFIIGNDSLKIWIENSELKLSTVLRDQDGKIVAKIEANEWQVNPNLIFDRNFDDKALEVINEKGEVILQAVFDGKTVQFCGKFYREDGWQIALGNNYMEFRPPGEKVQLTFTPIFKYPSAEYPGQRK